MSTAEKVALIESFDTPPGRAEPVASTELSQFSLDDINRILKCLSPLPKTKGTRDICGPAFDRHEDFPLRTKAIIWSSIGIAAAFLAPIQLAASVWLLWKGKRKAIWDEIPRPTLQLFGIYSDVYSYVKAPIHLVQRSIKQGAALCVDRNGRFTIREDGYTVMSHVWAETMGWQTPQSWGPVDLSLRKKGIARAHFLKFFDRCGADWLWVDVIAMPEVLEDMSDTEKAAVQALRVDVINCLHSIYTRADQVVVIDTLLLRLSTRSPVDVAVCLCMSFWMTRLWTFTEAYLAKKVVLKTKDWSFDLDEVIEFLGRNTNNDQERYYKLLWRLWLFRDEKFSGFPATATMTRVYYGSEHRHTNIEVDAARALFPLFQMEWQMGWTLHQGLAAILDHHPEAEDMLRKYCEYHGYDFASVGKVRKLHG